MQRTVGFEQFQAPHDYATCSSAAAVGRMSAINLAAHLVAVEDPLTDTAGR